MHEDLDVTSYGGIKVRVDLGRRARLVRDFEAKSELRVASTIQGALQVRQHAYAVFEVLRGYDCDFFADAAKFQITARIAHRQIADAERLDTTGQQRPLDVHFTVPAVYVSAETGVQQHENGIGGPRLRQAGNRLGPRLAGGQSGMFSSGALDMNA